MKMKQIAETREIKVAEKQQKLSERCMTMVKKQNRELEKKSALIDRCIVNKYLYYNDKPKKKIKDIKIQKEIREESPEQSLCLQVSEIDLKILLGISVTRENIERSDIMYQ